MDIEIGTTISGLKVGFKSKQKVIWLACPDCEKERWVNYTSLRRPNFQGRCKRCAQIANPNSKPKHNGRYIDLEGYVWVQIPPDSPYYPMVDRRGYVREHRLVMAQHLGRCLNPGEVPHHLGTIFPMGSPEDKGDNRIENLELKNPSSHMAEHNHIGAIRGIAKRKHQAKKSKYSSPPVI